MPIYDLRILLETVEGKKTSYYSSGSKFLANSFINTAVDNVVMSASMVRQRIVRMVSASYQNEAIFTGEVVNGGDDSSPNYFSGNTLLSATLSGSANTGSIVFTALDNEYDRLLRYKFIGEKVTNVLGLPSEQWIYVDQVRLPADDEANIFQGNANLGNVNISDTLTFAGGSDVNSDVPILIDTGSDRYIKFVDERAASVVALRMGYDVDTDTYEISGSDNFTFNIGNVNDIFVTDNILHQDDVDTGISFLSDLVTINAGGIEMMRAVESDIGDVVTFNEGGKDVNFRVESTGSAHMLFVDGGTNRVGINKQSPTHTLTVGGEISASGLVVAGGDIITTGDIIAENYIVKSTVTQMTTSFSSGSTIFGDSIDDTHQFTGSVDVSGSLTLNGGELLNSTTVTVMDTYLRKSFVKKAVSISNNSTASFTAVTASAPSGLTATSENDFVFFINGQYMEHDALTIQQAASSFLLKVNADSIGYDLESDDEIIAMGKFNS